MNSSVNEIKKKAIPILLDEGISKSALFGSHVREEQTLESDIDILVDYKQGTSLFDVVRLRNRLEKALGAQVDLVGYNTIKPRLRQYILSEQVRIL